MFSLLLATITNAAPIISNTPPEALINWTTILSVATVCITAMATAVKIFGTDKKSDEDIKSIEEDNQAFKDKQEEDSKELKEKQEDSAKEFNRRQEELKEKINVLIIEIEKSKIECSSNTKSIEELKKDYRILASRLDELLKQILEWFST
jgi:septal ring factor EnvC (AmiA/AmiB activator)